MRFEIEEEFGASVSYELPNTIARRPNGGATVIAFHARPLARYDLTKVAFTESIADYLLAFRDEIGGQAGTFGYRDPIDHRCDFGASAGTPYDTGMGSTEIGILYPEPDGTRVSFQLYKRYRVTVTKINPAPNPPTVTVHDRYRPIILPIAETCRVYEDGIERNVVINEDGGDVVFDEPPSGGSLLTWTGEFDTRVRFESSENIALETVVHDQETNSTVYNLPNLRLIEIKEDPAIASPTPDDSPIDDSFLDHLLGVEISYGSIVQPTTITLDTDLDSGYQYKRQQGDLPNTRISVNPQGFLQSNEARYLVALYRVLYGTAISFRIPDYQGISQIPDRLSATPQLLNQMAVRFATPLSISVERDEIDARGSLYRARAFELERSIVAPAPSYHVFGTYFSKHINASCDQPSFWRTANPIPVVTDDGAIRQNDLSFAIVGNVWKLLYRGVEYDIMRVTSDAWFERSTLPPLEPGSGADGYNAFFGFFLIYTPRNGACTGNTETPSYPRGDDPVIVDIVLIGDGFGFVPAQLLAQSPTVLLSAARFWCHGWLISFDDGESLGFTDHDRPFVLDTVTYSPRSGYRAEATAIDSSTAEIRSELSSVITADEVTEEDLLTERYERATVEMFLYDWGTKTKIRTLFTGSFGDLSIDYDINGAARFTIQARSDRAKLSQRATLVTTNLCRLKYGGTGKGQCNFPIATRTDTHAVTAINANGTFTANTGRGDGYYDRGELTFTSGRLTGLIREVRSFTGNTFAFALPFPFSPEIGDTFAVTDGCDRSEAACKSRGNFRHFGGFPFVPGIDQVMVNGRIVTENEN